MNPARILALLPLLRDRLPAASLARLENAAQAMNQIYRVNQASPERGSNRPRQRILPSV